MASQSSENIKLNSLIKCDKLLFKRGIQGLTFSGPDPDQDLGIVTFSTEVPPHCNSEAWLQHRNAQG